MLKLVKNYPKVNKRFLSVKMSLLSVKALFFYINDILMAVLCR